MGKITEILYLFSDGTKLVFDKGKIDNYRVSFYRGPKRLCSPRDERVFSQLTTLNPAMAWSTICYIAEQIDNKTNFEEVNLPFNESLRERKLFASLAAMMIAEEKISLRLGTNVGKLIKLLGCYQVLIEGKSPRYAALWSVQRNPYEIMKRCRQCGLISKSNQLSLLGEET